MYKPKRELHSDKQLITLYVYSKILDYVYKYIQAFWPTACSINLN